MKEFLDFIEKKIKDKIDIEKIVVIDNSRKHKTHKFFDKDKYHICLEIHSKYLKKLKRLESQRLIMSILNEELKNKIHALEIKIK
tara:strand:+ start:110 stop:364 length:255 start_codon:yes stop_codon:yes gene_type:complete